MIWSVRLCHKPSRVGNQFSAAFNMGRKWAPLPLSRGLHFASTNTPLYSKTLVIVLFSKEMKNVTSCQLTIDGFVYLIFISKSTFQIIETTIKPVVYFKRNC